MTSPNHILLIAYPKNHCRMLAVAITWLFLLSPLLADSVIFYESEPIQRKIDTLKSTLDSLPLTATHAAPWTLGYASHWDDLPGSPLTIEIKFPKPEEIDLVALFPATYHDENNVKQSFGFPIRFSLERLLPDGSSQIIANHLNSDYPEPGMGPQLFPCPDPLPAIGLRITVTQRAINKTWWKASHLVAFSELFAFVGERNVALRADVKTTSSYIFERAWSPAYLTDGFSLYSQLNHKIKDPTKCFQVMTDQAQLQMDLGKTRQIDEIRLWPVVRAIQHNYPLKLGLGFPQFLRVELSNKPDFSDAVVIYEASHLELQPGGGPWMQPISPSKGRYVRWSLGDGVREYLGKNQPEICLGEIEILENGLVVSQGLPVLVSDQATSVSGLELLTDGFVSEGEILPLRQWLTQFHQRIAIGQQLKVLWPAATEARIRDEKRSATLLFIAIGVILALAQAIWLVRVAAHRRWARMRERISSDLHDEIGSNVSSIAHTAELLKESLSEPNVTQTRLLNNLIENAHLTTRETKHFVRFIESEEQDLDLTEQFAQVASRILGTISVSFSLENTRSFNALDPSTKWNLLLFYKEALNNIIKHAAASSVEIHTSRMGSKLRMEISDNGKGFDQALIKCRHLESRSKVLGGQLELRSSNGAGSRIILTFPRNLSS
jgi:signal transduction histidine kinase